MRVLLIANATNPHARRIESVASLVNGCQRFYRLDYVTVEEFRRTNRQQTALTLVKQIEARWPEQRVILVTEDSFVDNWFSHEYRSCAAITISDWESSYAPPSMRAYLTYQIAQALMHFSADMSEEMALNMVHEPPVGCIYDMTMQKANIKLGMVAGQVCPKCVGQLRALGTLDGAIDAVVQIVALVRAEALGRPIAFDPQEVFVVMRFTNNDENDNAWRYGIQTGVTACGLRAVRGDSYVESGQILQKVDKALRRSRLIVAKVDEKNLNVYFELGLAMGLGKDVLLISENSLILDLPSDLRSWECLTYDRGNYQQLCDKIKRYLSTEYRLPAIASV